MPEWAFFAIILQIKKGFFFFSPKFKRDFLMFPLTVQGYRILWTGMGAQLARDVPFSGICWSTLEPVSSYLL